MDLCPICGNSKQDVSILCTCGYNYEKEEITDNGKICVYFSKIKSTKSWEGEVKLIERVHQVQQKKHGRSLSGARGGWTINKTANLLKTVKSVVSPKLRLAERIDVDPEILKIEKITDAIKELNINKSIIRNRMKQFETEKELQSYLEKNWGKIKIFEGWNLKESQKNMGEAGVIDILAHHNSEPKWLIIEVKKSRSSDNTVGQIQRYMGWVKENIAAKNEEVLGRIISGYPPGNNIKSALLVTKNIDLLIYYLENDQIEFIEPDAASLLDEFEKLPIEKQRKLLEELVTLK